MTDHPRTKPIPCGRTFGLATKFVLFVVGISLIPLSVQVYDLFYSTKILEEQVENDYRQRAAGLADDIHVLLKERYQDLLIFSRNRVFLDQPSWEKAREWPSPIVEVLNRYVQTGGDYYLIFFVDTEGRLIAVNDQDEQGRPIPTQKLYQKNFLGSSWVQGLKTSETDGLSFNDDPSRSPKSVPVIVEKVIVDPDVKEMFPQESALTMGFSTAVYEGNVLVGFYSHRMKFSTIEALFQDSYQEMKKAGLADAEIILQDGQGFSLIEYAPAVHQAEKVLHDFDNVSLKLNWAQSGFQPAQLAVKGLSGASSHFHPGKQSMQFVGYSPLQKDPGFPSPTWSVLIQVPEEQALLHLHRMGRNQVVDMILVVGMALVGGVFFRKTIAVRSGTFYEPADTVPGADRTCKMPMTGQDEYDRPGQGLNNLSDHRNLMVAQTFQAVHGEFSSSEKGFAADEKDPSLNQVGPFPHGSISEPKTDLTSTAPMAMRNFSNVTDAGIDFDSCLKKETGFVSAAQSIESVTPGAPDCSSGPSYDEPSFPTRNLVDILEHITERTDFLALTIAVETVRADAQGRGLSVAAQEFRTLAERTKKATNEIVSILQAVQSDSSDPARFEKNDKQEDSSGVLVAREAGIRLMEIVNGVQRVVDMIQPIVKILPPCRGQKRELRSGLRSQRINPGYLSCLEGSSSQNMPVMVAGEAPLER